MRIGFHPHASTLGWRHRIHRQLNPVRPQTWIVLAVTAAVVALCTAGLGSGSLTALSVLLFAELLIGAGVAGYMYLAEITGPDGRHWIAVHDGGLAVRSRHGEPLVLPWSRVGLDEIPVDPGEPAVPRMLVWVTPRRPSRPVRAGRIRSSTRAGMSPGWSPTPAGAGWWRRCEPDSRCHRPGFPAR
jgi:hypothetical protein